MYIPFVSGDWEKVLWNRPGVLAVEPVLHADGTSKKSASDGHYAPHELYVFLGAYGKKHRFTTGAQLLLLVIILGAAFVLSGISEHGGFLHTYVRDPPKTLNREKLDAVFTAACVDLDIPPRPSRPCPPRPL